MINHYRPISLCNVTYKILSNILVSRIRPLINTIISPYQNAFVAKCLISDNIALAHELLHTMKSKKSKTSYTALKIDLEKAYDKLEWNFIRKSLEHCNFLNQLINWIMISIESVSFDLHINGHISESWNPKRGIRQGDPLSSYIFIICLNFLILKFVEGHKSKQSDGLQINKNTPPILILCYVDDCIIFYKTNDKSINFFQNTLQCFAEEAGLNINWNKTKAFFSKNITKKRIKEISNKHQIKVENIGEKYLGLPFNVQSIVKESFYDIINKTQVKISNWYHKFLSSQVEVL